MLDFIHFCTKTCSSRFLDVRWPDLMGMMRRSTSTKWYSSQDCAGKALPLWHCAHTSKLHPGTTTSTLDENNLRDISSSRSLASVRPAALQWACSSYKIDLEIVLHLIWRLADNCKRYSQAEVDKHCECTLSPLPHSLPSEYGLLEKIVH